jgi:hypothetical protein
VKLAVIVSLVVSADDAVIAPVGPVAGPVAVCENMLSPTDVTSVVVRSFWRMLFANVFQGLLLAFTVPLVAPSVPMIVSVPPGEIAEPGANSKKAKTTLEPVPVVVGVTVMLLNSVGAVGLGLVKEPELAAVPPFHDQVTCVKSMNA